MDVLLPYKTVKGRFVYSRSHVAFYSQQLPYLQKTYLFWYINDRL